MKPHPRIRTTIKWGGAAVTVLLLVVWIGSGRWYGYQYLTTSTSVGYGDGCVKISHAVKLQLHAERHWFAFKPSGFDLTGGFGDSAPEPWFHLSWRPIHTRSVGGDEYWAIPIWIGLVPCLLLTILAWHLDTLARHRVLAGACPNCHYDRTGLVVGAKCPECGGVPGNT